MAVIEAAAQAVAEVPAAEVVAANNADAANAEEAEGDAAAADVLPAVSPGMTSPTATTANRGLWNPAAVCSNYTPTDTAFSAIRDKTTSGCGATRSCRAR